MRCAILVSFDQHLVNVIDVLAWVLGFDKRQDFLSIRTHGIICEVISPFSHDLVDIWTSFRVFLQKGLKYKIAQILWIEVGI